MSTSPTGTRNTGLAGSGEVAVRGVQLEPLGGQRIEKEKVSAKCLFCWSRHISRQKNTISPKLLNKNVIK